MRRVRGTFLGGIALVALLACAAPAGAQTIAEVVGASGAVGEFDGNKNDFDILNIAVDTAGLGAALSDPMVEYTVFAPNDRAFIRLARDLGFTGNDEAGAWGFLAGVITDLGGGDPTLPVLTDILLYHVADGAISPFGLIVRTLFGLDITTLGGGTIEPFFFRLRDNDPDLRDPRVRWPFNLVVDNGVVHTIDRVLIPVDL